MTRNFPKINLQQVKGKSKTIKRFSEKNYDNTMKMYLNTTLQAQICNFLAYPDDAKPP